MPLAKILLFYVFTPLADPDAVRLWQRDLAESLGLRGRILISEDGLNGTLGGEMRALKRYVRKTRDYAPFKAIDFTWSEGTGLDDEGASTGLPEAQREGPERDRVVRCARRAARRRVGRDRRRRAAEPDALHELVAERGEDVVFFDGRNAVEAAIGRFRDAIVPHVETTRDFVALLDSGAYDDLKGRPVVTYCTGGIRCEVLSSLMASRGFGEVYQLDGGIVRYGERFGDDGLWEGSLYVFDGRGSVDFSDHAAVIGGCEGCGARRTAPRTARMPRAARSSSCARRATVRRAPRMHRPLAVA